MYIAIREKDTITSRKIHIHFSSGRITKGGGGGGVKPPEPLRKKYFC